MSDLNNAVDFDNVRQDARAFWQWDKHTTPYGTGDWTYNHEELLHDMTECGNTNNMTTVVVILFACGHHAFRRQAEIPYASLHQITGEAELAVEGLAPDHILRHPSIKEAILTASLCESCAQKPLFTSSTKPYETTLEAISNIVDDNLEELMQKYFNISSYETQTSSPSLSPAAILRESRVYTLFERDLEINIASARRTSKALLDWLPHFQRPKDNSAREGSSEHSGGSGNGSGSGSSNINSGDKGSEAAAFRPAALSLAHAIGSCVIALAATSRAIDYFEHGPTATSVVDYLAELARYSSMDPFRPEAPLAPVAHQDRNSKNASPRKPNTSSNTRDHGGTTTSSISTTILSPLPSNRHHRHASAVAAAVAATATATPPADLAEPADPSSYNPYTHLPPSATESPFIFSRYECFFEGPSLRAVPVGTATSLLEGLPGKGMLEKLFPPQEQQQQQLSPLIPPPEGGALDRGMGIGMRGILGAGREEGFAKRGAEREVGAEAGDARVDEMDREVEMPVPKAAWECGFCGPDCLCRFMGVPDQ